MKKIFAFLLVSSLAIAGTMSVKDSLQDYYVHVNQDGSINIQSISGPIALPQGASTSVNQSVQIGFLSSIANSVASVAANTSSTVTSVNTVDSDILLFKSANHSDLSQLDTDLLAFKSANHSDVSSVITNTSSTVTNTSSTVTSVNQVDTDLNAFKSANHSDLNSVITNQTNGLQKVQRVDQNGNVAPSGDTLSRASYVQITDKNTVAKVIMIGSVGTLSTNIVQTVTPIDKTVSGNITIACVTPTDGCSTGSYVAMATNGISAVDVTIGGTGVGASLNVDGTGDGIFWVPLFTSAASSGQYTTSSFSASGKYKIYRAAGLQQVRVRAASISSGTVTATINGSAGTAVIEAVQLNPGNFTTSINGLSQTSQPTAISGGSYGVQTLDPYLRMPFVTEESINSRWGIMFDSTTGIVSTGSTAETPIGLMINPIDSGKNIRISKIIFDSPAAANNFNNYFCYIDPTVTSNGTALNIVGKRQTNQNTTIASTFKLPTVSANGTQFFSITASYGATTPIDIGFTQWLEPNHKLMCTVDQSQAGGTSGISIEWAEE